MYVSLEQTVQLIFSGHRIYTFVKGKNPQSVICYVSSFPECSMQSKICDTCNGTPVELGIHNFQLIFRVPNSVCSGATDDHLLEQEMSYLRRMLPLYKLCWSGYTETDPDIISDFEHQDNQT